MISAGIYNARLFGRVAKGSETTLGSHLIR